MNRSEYVPFEEVQRVCKELGIRDWSALQEIRISQEEAVAILKALDLNGMEVEVEAFRMGLEVELEHGMADFSTNITNNHPILTGKIVLAHLKRAPDYYLRLKTLELECEMLKAAVAKEPVKVEVIYKKLLQTNLLLKREEVKRLSREKF